MTTRKSRGEKVVLFLKEHPDLHDLAKGLILDIFEYSKKYSAANDPEYKILGEIVYQSTLKAVKKGIMEVRDKKEIKNRRRREVGKTFIIRDPDEPIAFCRYCHNPILGDGWGAAPHPLKRYCSKQCQLNAYYERRSGNRRENIEIHDVCVICGKSLKKRRRGAKTCGSTCRSALRRRSLKS